MTSSRFHYVICIRTTAEKLWMALIEPEYTRLYWCETHQESTWNPGDPWRLIAPDGRLADSGQVVEFTPCTRLAVTWQNHLFPETEAEGFSRMSYDLAAKDDCVMLTLIHEMDKPDSKLIAAVSTGWPVILSSLKTMLETGEPLDATRRWPQGI